MGHIAKVYINCFITLYILLHISPRKRFSEHQDESSKYDGFIAENKKVYNLLIVKPKAEHWLMTHSQRKTWILAILKQLYRPKSRVDLRSLKSSLLLVRTGDAGLDSECHEEPMIRVERFSFNSTNEM